MIRVLAVASSMRGLIPSILLLRSAEHVGFSFVVCSFQFVSRSESRTSNFLIALNGLR